ncbi:MAG: ATP-dependent DNA helicase RecG [Betaproteobacteria bacterium]|nr:ATP-dependent DNA helicase RecG [Betaproteobacteria bacterium]
MTPPAQFCGTGIVASPAVLAKLKKLGIARRDDLILHLPLRYEDETVVTPMSSAPWGEAVQIEGVAREIGVALRPRRQLVVRIGGVGAEDEGCELFLRFLNFYASQVKQFEKARDEKRVLRVFGEIRQGFYGPEMVHPRYRPVTESGKDLPCEMTPVYPATAGLSQKTLRGLIAAALEGADLSDPLALEEKPGFVPALPSFAEAIRQLHAPPAGIAAEELDTLLAPAWQRIRFDELLAQQLSLRIAYRARRQKTAPCFAPPGALAERFLAALPFSLTNAQQRVSAGIAADLAQPYPMQRLLQGDVGSGKTVVAALAALQAIGSGWQVALMAPTEILAGQHYRKLSGWLAALGLSTVWLSGALTPARKKATRAAASEAQLVVGTHALIQEGVDFSRLGLVIVDEQHRFGVMQRLSLRRKGELRGKGGPGGSGEGELFRAPHQLMMSATPIPRTLAMSYYADLDVSTLDELPPGRAPVRTKLFSAARREEVIARARALIDEGGQAYWVCPLIEESEALQLQTALETFDALSEAFVGYTVGLVHGRQKGEEKASTMSAFAAGSIDLLVATTVIEVGVDVPNASLMVIEHAERFGLAQLHQLRGRVGRGTRESVCALLYAPPLSPLARERLKIIYTHHDGFEIAREDLRLRGPGEFVGSRQSGVPLLRYADLENDAELIESARACAEWMLNKTPTAAAFHLERWLGTRKEMLKV